VSRRTWDVITPFLVVFGLVAVCNAHVALGAVLMGIAVITWRKGT